MRIGPCILQRQQDTVVTDIFLHQKPGMLQEAIVDYMEQNWLQSQVTQQTIS